jgi:hypothetical protein
MEAIHLNPGRQADLLNYRQITYWSKEQGYDCLDNDANPTCISRAEQ